MNTTTNSNWFKGATFSIIDSHTGARMRAATEQESSAYINRGPCLTGAVRLGGGISVDVDARECGSDELQGWRD